MPETTASQPRLRVAVITSIAYSLPNFRGPLMSAMLAAGAEVYALAPDYDDATREAVTKLGATPVDISMDRTGIRPFQDAIDLLRLTGTLRSLRPDVTFSYFIKPVIYGTIAAALAGCRRRYALVAGLGYLFAPREQGAPQQRRLLRTIASLLYAIAFRLCGKVFFQNRDDIAELSAAGVLPPGKTCLLNGTGVDLAKYEATPPPTSPVTFILMARLIREKGICQYVDAARRVKATKPDVRILLLGGLDANPGGLEENEIRGWVEEGVIEWAGHVNDVRPWLEQSSVFVLPSYYREGKPRSTQEALAMGRPVITTDTPGCRDTVEDGVNGFLVAPRNVDQLTDAMLRLAVDPALIKRLGSASRAMAERDFDVHVINARMLSEMQLARV